MNITVEVEGRADDAESFRTWLKSDPTLRPHVQSQPRPATPGTMGLLDALAVAVVPETVPVFAQVVAAWWRSRHHKGRITLRGPGGTVEVTPDTSGAEFEVLVKFVAGEAGTRDGSPGPRPREGR